MGDKKTVSSIEEFRTVVRNAARALETSHKPNPSDNHSHEAALTAELQAIESLRHELSSKISEGGSSAPAHTQENPSLDSIAENFIRAIEKSGVHIDPSLTSPLSVKAAPKGKGR
jgi:hypothetical protein